MYWFSSIYVLGLWKMHGIHAIAHFLLNNGVFDDILKYYNNHDGSKLIIIAFATGSYIYFKR